MENEDTIKLGDKVKSKVSPYQGMVTAMAVYLHSTPQVLVTCAQLDNDGSQHSMWLDMEAVDKI